MSRKIISERLQIDVNDLKGPFEICDVGGRVLAYVVPGATEVLYDRWTPEIDDAELDQRELTEETYSTAEVLKHLEGL